MVVEGAKVGGRGEVVEVDGVVGAARGSDVAACGDGGDGGLVGLVGEKRGEGEVRAFKWFELEAPNVFLVRACYQTHG